MPLWREQPQSLDIPSTLPMTGRSGGQRQTAGNRALPSFQWWQSLWVGGAPLQRGKWRSWAAHWQGHCHHLAVRNNETQWAAAASSGRWWREEGGFKVSYCHENNLLHLNLGDQPDRDFCHHNRDFKIPIEVADFYNSLHQKYDKNHENHYQERRGRVGGGRAQIPIGVAEFYNQLTHFIWCWWCFFTI